MWYFVKQVRNAVWNLHDLFAGYLSQVCHTSCAILTQNFLQCFPLIILVDVIYVIKMIISAAFNIQWLMWILLDSSVWQSNWATTNSKSLYLYEVWNYNSNLLNLPRSTASQATFRRYHRSMVCLAVCLSRSCIVLKRQKISTRCRLHRIPTCLSQNGLKFDLHRLTPSCPDFCPCLCKRQRHSMPNCGRQVRDSTRSQWKAHRKPPSLFLFLMTPSTPIDLLYIQI